MCVCARACVQFVSLAVVLLRFRNGLAGIKYELLAGTAIGLWILKTLLTYRNALVRYEALRLRLLTSKTLVRSSVDTRPVIRYISQEAATQRARGALRPGPGRAGPAQVVLFFSRRRFRAIRCASTFPTSGRTALSGRRAARACG